MSKDNTPTWIYFHSEGCIKEQPKMDKPEDDHDTVSFVYLRDQYKKHLSELKIYPIVLSKELDGQEVKEGEHFFLMGAREARIFSDAIWIDHKTLPIRGAIALPMKKEMIDAKLDSNPLAFYSQKSSPIASLAKREGQEEKNKAKEMAGDSANLENLWRDIDQIIDFAEFTEVEKYKMIKEKVRFFNKYYTK